jgi:hypothetical protein
MHTGHTTSGKEQCDDGWEAAAGEGKANQESLADQRDGKPTYLGIYAAHG